MKKSKILFDLYSSQPNDGAKRHGGGRYAEVILKRIVERGLEVSCFYDSSRWFNPEIKKLIEDSRISLYDLRKMPITEIVKESSTEVVFSSLPFALNDLGKYNLIGTIHGLRRLETSVDWHSFRYKSTFKEYIRMLIVKLFPSLGLIREYKSFGNALSVPNCNFVTVSNHTKHALKSYFPHMKDEDFPVFYSPSTSCQCQLEVKCYDKYFLLVSANRWEKNNLRAIMALDDLFSNGYLSDTHVRVVGVKNEDKYFYSIKNKDKFKFYDYVDDLELEQLYHDAYCLLYPSLNEGFGYPPLEAMHHGTPVIASPFTSIPEICGDAVLYTNPYSIQEMKNRIIMMNDENIRNNYSRLAVERYEYITNKQRDDLDRLIDYIYS